MSSLPWRSGALAYVRTRADERFWTEHWDAESLDHLLAVAETSQLTRFIERHVRPGDRMLEAGCGLGQYVAYFGARGVETVGVDFSEHALARHRERFPASELHLADLARLPFPDASFDVCLSLGVIEHYVAGANTILEEAARVLKGDGALLLSTPYLNASRRLLRRRIKRLQREVAERGGEFYQYAFSAAAPDRILEAAGFRVRERSFYDPGRGLRDLHALFWSPKRPPAPPAHAPGAPPRARGRLKRAILYASPTLELLAHLQIVWATRSRAKR